MLIKSRTLFQRILFSPSVSSALVLLTAAKTTYTVALAIEEDVLVSTYIT